MSEESTNPTPRPLSAAGTQQPSVPTPPQQPDSSVVSASKEDPLQHATESDISTKTDKELAMPEQPSVKPASEETIAPPKLGTTETESQPSEPVQPTVADTVSLSAMIDKEEPADVAEKSEKEEAEAASGEDKTKMIPQNLESFKEESNRPSDLSDSERKSLEELKQLVQEAVNTHQFSSNPKTEEGPPEEISIWGVPLLKDERTDVILLKFLRARDFKVKDSFTMIKNTIQWRKEFQIDELVDEDLGDDLDKVVFMHGHDREGHPVCYNVYGEFQNKELYNKTFSDEEKRKKFLRWRVQFLERSIRKLDFSPGGVCTIFQINDLKNSPGPGKTELRLATKQAVHLLQDNYPEFVAKQAFINVPWWYLAFYTMISPFMTQRSKSKLVFAGPPRSAETLFKYISPEQVPIQYGGLSVDLCDCNPDFSIDDTATEIIVKPGTKQTVEITIYEKCVIVWEIRVVGWEVSYKAEFVPEAKDAYTVIIQKPRKMGPKDEPVVCQSFKVSDLGKVLFTVDNPTTKKKKLLYRFQVKPFSD